MDYNSFPFMAFNREPLVKTKFVYEYLILITGILELVSIHGIYTFYIWAKLFKAGLR